MRGGDYSSKEIEFVVNENGCHICISHSKDTGGYPKIVRNKKIFHISRYLWEKKYGPIPEGMCVLHKCDTPACINVDHFFLGTNDDNMKDMVVKNRNQKGEKKENHKLTEDQVLKIRKDTRF